MRKVVIATHGALASGFKSTLGLISGCGEAVQALGFFCDDGVDAQDLERCFMELHDEDQLIICTDVRFGSVAQLALRLAAKYPKSNAVVIAGVNLPLLLELTAGNSNLGMDGLHAMVQTAASQVEMVCAHSGEMEIHHSESSDDEGFFE